MANMKKRRKAPATKAKPTQYEIDAIVIGQADDERAWEGAVVVKRPKSALLSIPADLAARAAFLVGRKNREGTCGNRRVGICGCQEDSRVISTAEHGAPDRRAARVDSGLLQGDSRAARG